MITVAAICAAVPGLEEGTLLAWVAADLVRPVREAGEPAFREIDVARVRLIFELHRELEVEAPTVPLVLSLMDQLYATRRQLRLVLEALDAGERAKLGEVVWPVLGVE